MEGYYFPPRSPDRNRTYNPLVNSQMLCLIELRENNGAFYTHAQVSRSAQELNLVLPPLREACIPIHLLTVAEPGFEPGIYGL